MRVSPCYPSLLLLQTKATWASVPAEDHANQSGGFQHLCPSPNQVPEAGRFPCRGAGWDGTPQGEERERANVTPGPRAPLASLPVGLQGPRLGLEPASPLGRGGSRAGPAQAATGSPGLGAAGGADGAERSATGGGVGGGG